MTNFRNLPNFLTIFRMTLSVLSVFMLLSGWLTLWVWFFIVALVLDVVDGALARKLQATSDFGTQLDSFADFIAFGFVPTVFIFVQRHHDMNFAYPLSVFLVAGVIRLSLYNTRFSDSKSFQGVPIPLAALLLVLSQWFGSLLLMIVIAVLALAMVAPVRIPSLKGFFDGK